MGRRVGRAGLQFPSKEGPTGWKPTPVHVLGILHSVYTHSCKPTRTHVSTHTCSLTRRSAPLQQGRGCPTRPHPRTHSLPIDLKNADVWDQLSHRQLVDAGPGSRSLALHFDRSSLLILVPLPTGHVQLREQRSNWGSNLSKAPQ